MDSFSSWLHSENYNLNQKGNMYRVSELSEEHPEGSPSSTLLNARKTVRFSEPRRPPAMDAGYTNQPSLLQPPPDFSNVAGYYGTYPDDIYDDLRKSTTHDDSDGSILMIPGRLPVMKFKPEDGSLV